MVEQQLTPWPEERLPRASSGVPTQELQTLAALKLQVGMLDQQIHLQKIPKAELLPWVSTQEPLGPPWLAPCCAMHGLLEEGGQRFPLSSEMSLLTEPFLPQDSWFWVCWGEHPLCGHS